MGFTLNLMTMLALTLSVGIVIDDAIVVLENIYRFIEEKHDDQFHAAVEATQEIGLAVLATTLSLVAIFVPVAFHGRHRRHVHEELRPDDGVRDHGVAARELHPDADALGAVVEGQDPRQGSAQLERLQGVRRRRRLLHAIARVVDGHRWIVAIVAVLVLFSSVPLFMMANKNFMPQDDQSEFEVNLRADEGTSLESTEVLSNRIANSIRQRIPRSSTPSSRWRATRPRLATWAPSTSA
jgi:HAE1 family hydrophobic/amphiphilic exporter-1